MGYDNIGILFYGIVLGEQELPWDDPEHKGSWMLYYLERTGFLKSNPRPEGEPDPSDREAYSRWCREQHDPWMDRRDAAVGAAGCVVGIYNSCHNPWSYVALEVAHHEGDCKPPLELNPETAMLLPPDCDDIIRRFCDQMDIEYQQPGWYLTGLHC